MSVVFPNEIDEVLPGFEVIQSGALVLCVCYVNMADRG